ncbi:hypothetical protein I6N95_14290 [Vagococcus sp. BWB3-3]|uniref:Uncharacterized protein n=1 Tax=Vagococcus allomyrinae TaxID=2794353 RepID=A0A940P5W2_9ENTE|nr:hypothetical protein [Vagococcus allomyrinae]MBP1042184.1 hypothetical protein [Vagococcus allomyrinae]
MPAHQFQKQKKKLKRKLLTASYVGLTGLIFFIYSVQTLNKLLDQQEFYYQYTVPKLIQWLFDQIGPMLTIALSLLISSLMITFGLYQLFTYRTQFAKLDSSVKKEQFYDFKMMIDED